MKCLHNLKKTNLGRIIPPSKTKNKNNNRNGIKKDNEKTKTTVKSLDNVKTFSG